MRLEGILRAGGIKGKGGGGIGRPVKVNQRVMATNIRCRMTVLGKEEGGNQFLGFRLEPDETGGQVTLSYGVHSTLDAEEINKEAASRLSDS